MKRTDFAIAYNNIKNGGKEYINDYLQYCGFFFLQLTQKQTEKIFDLLVEFGYPTEEHHNMNWIVFPNGMQLTKDIF